MIWLGAIAGLAVLVLVLIGAAVSQHRRADAGPADVWASTAGDPPSAATDRAENPVVPSPPSRTTTTTWSPMDRYKPSFVMASQPPPGYVGRADVFSASGIGPTLTPPFTLHGGQLSGGMQQSGRGVYLYLVRDGAEVGPTDQPVASCTDGCATGGWGSVTSPPPGRYRIKVVAGPSVGWRFDLSQNLQPALALKVTPNPDGSVRVEARGIGDQETEPFTLVGAAQQGRLRLLGTFYVEGAAVFYLVPKGQQLQPQQNLKARAGTSGGLTLPDVPAGEYRLVVRTTGPWGLDLDSGMQ